MLLYSVETGIVIDKKNIPTRAKLKLMACLLR